MRVPLAANCAADEINAYLGIRDLALAEAEETPTQANLDRAWAANEFAEKCLQPARSPYQAQSLPEGDAIHARQRCKTVKMRIAELRARKGADHFARRRRAA